MGLITRRSCPGPPTTRAPCPLCRAARTPATVDNAPGSTRAASASRAEYLMSPVASTISESLTLASLGRTSRDYVRVEDGAWVGSLPLGQRPLAGRDGSAPPPPELGRVLGVGVGTSVAADVAVVCHLSSSTRRPEGRAHDGTAVS